MGNQTPSLFKILQFKNCISITNLILILQVANLAVVAYFTAALFSRQYLLPDSDAHTTFPNVSMAYSPKKPFDTHTPDLCFPFFTIIELVCYMGWIKVAETLLNPFGGLYIPNYTIYIYIYIYIIRNLLVNLTILHRYHAIEY